MEGPKGATLNNPSKTSLGIFISQELDKAVKINAG